MSEAGVYLTESTSSALRGREGLASLGPDPLRNDNMPAAAGLRPGYSEILVNTVHCVELNDIPEQIAAR